MILFKEWQKNRLRLLWSTEVAIHHLDGCFRVAMLVMGRALGCPRVLHFRVALVSMLSQPVLAYFMYLVWPFAMWKDNSPFIWSIPFICDMGYLVQLNGEGKGLCYSSIIQGARWFIKRNYVYPVVFSLRITWNPAQHLVLLHASVALECDQVFLEKRRHFDFWYCRNRKNYRAKRNCPPPPILI